MRLADHSSRGVLWMSVCCECCVLSGRGLCDWLITRPDESYGCLYVPGGDEIFRPSRPALGPTQPPVK